MTLNKVGLIYSEDFQKYNFGPQHPLRPLRLSLTYNLMDELGLLRQKRLEILKPRLCTRQELEMVHASDYVDVVKKLSENPDDLLVKPFVYGLGPGDNPIFQGMYEASALVCGASVVAAEKVWNDDDFYAAFNFSGGLHHAMKNRASGFCIFNDIAVAIKHLKKLKKDIRIAYVDIDCHHGDGVQWIFYDDPNVLTISVHQSGRSLFPGTGGPDELGEGLGRGYSLNFPLLPKTPNKVFLKLFRACIPKLLEAYAPDILISQLGVDTHQRDPLTNMGLSISIHRDISQTLFTCVKDYCQNKWLALGGGGYLMTVVPRAWSVYLAKMLDVDLDNELPARWREEAIEKVPYEDHPNLLWDHDDEAVRLLLRNPEYRKKMIDYTNSLIEICEKDYLPYLTKK